MPDNKPEVDRINRILAGPQTTSVDGQTVTYNFDSLRKERDRLMAEDDVNGYRARRSIRSIDFG